jgi:hypothetical protein
MDLTRGGNPEAIPSLSATSGDVGLSLPASCADNLDAATREAVADARVQSMPVGGNEDGDDERTRLAAALGVLGIEFDVRGVRLDGTRRERRPELPFISAGMEARLSKIIFV